MKDKIAREQIEKLKEDIQGIRGILEDSGIMWSEFKSIVLSPNIVHHPRNILAKINAIMDYLNVEEFTTPPINGLRKKTK